MSKLCGEATTWVSGDGGFMLTCELLGEHRGMHRQVVDGHEYLWYPSEFPVCRGCGNQIDPTTCCCGGGPGCNPMNDGHSFVPMGCTCGYKAADEVLKELTEREAASTERMNMREFRYIEAPRTYVATGLPEPLVFLAGGITGCLDWQSEVVRELQPLGEKAKVEWPCTILNPRRAKFPMSDPSAAEEQIMWEFMGLRLAHIVVFWFAAETVQPIVLYELGATLERWSHDHRQQIVIGMDPKYQRRQDVEIQSLLQLGHGREIHYSLAALIEDLQAHITDLTEE
jgi:hypothetical protein